MDTKTIIEQIIKYIPTQLLDLTDDKTALVSRILKNSNINGELSIDNKLSSAANAQSMLIAAGDVTLKNPILEPHIRITESGKFMPFNLEIPQVNLRWVVNGDKLDCIILYVEGDSEVWQSWKLI